VGELRPRRSPEGLRDGLPHQGRRQGGVAATHSLAAAEDVGYYLEGVGREEAAGPAEARDDLVKDEEDVVLVAELSQIFRYSMEV